jgi:hypothetical protein
MSNLVPVVVEQTSRGEAYGLVDEVLSGRPVVPEPEPASARG